MRRPSCRADGRHHGLEPGLHGLAGVCLSFGGEGEGIDFHFSVFFSEQDHQGCALQPWKCVLGSPETRVVGNWGATDELLSTSGVKETFQNWIWGVLPQQPKHTWAGRNPEGWEGPGTRLRPLLRSRAGACSQLESSRVDRSGSRGLLTVGVN